MLSEHRSNTLTKVLSYGSLAVTLAVISGFGYDPVNLPKLMILILLAGLCFGIWSFSAKKIIGNHNFKIIIMIYGAFLLGLILSTALGASPAIMNIYGTYARNTGALAYLALMIISISAALLQRGDQVRKIISVFLFCLLFNVLYGVYINLTDNDIFAWNNPYGNFLGTFGNPNFISAFLGIGFSVSLAYFLFSKSIIWIRLLFLILLPAELYLIIETNSLQGMIVSLLGLTIILFFIIRRQFHKTLLYFYSAIATFIGGLTVLGMLQIGPLTEYVYKTTVSVRGEYWRAGLKMFLESPVWGIGLDSYGDFYRRMRGSTALTWPGVNTVTDAAHNVFIDILAGGGLVLFLPFTAIQIYIFYKCVLFLRINKGFDPVFVSLFVGWITYLAQSVISISQLGLAIWGWLFMGLLIAYTSLNTTNDDSLHLVIKGQKSKKINSKPAELAAGNVVTIAASLIVAALFAFPPIIAEHNWRSQLEAKNVAKFIEAAGKWPQTNQRFIQTADILNKSQNLSDSLNVLRDGIKFDPNFRDYWWYIYNLTPNNLEKAEALKNLKRLDPLNLEQK